MPARFGYMTNDLDNLKTAREMGQLDGYTVDMLPLDAPAPELGTYDGIMVDLAPAGRHAFARKTFVSKLVQLAKVFPVVVFDDNASYQETAQMRGAGIKWFPVLKAQAFKVMLAHPLAAKVEPKVEMKPEAKPADAKRDGTESEVTSAVG
jgi:hypothetical protein